MTKKSIICYPSLRICLANSKVPLIECILDSIEWISFFLNSSWVNGPIAITAFTSLINDRTSEEDILSMISKNDKAVEELVKIMASTLFFSKSETKSSQMTFILAVWTSYKNNSSTFIPILPRSLAMKSFDALLRGMIILFGAVRFIFENSSTIPLAEYFSGTKWTFIPRLTRCSLVFGPTAIIVLLFNREII